MKRSLLTLCALLLAAPFAAARGGGRGFTGGRGFSGARASSGFHAPSGFRTASGPRGSSGGFSRGFSGGFSRSAFRPSFASSRASFRAVSRPAVSRSFGRATFHAAASKTSRRLSGSASDGTAAPAWTTIGAKIVSAGQPPVYSQAAGGGTHSVEGGGFIAMDQSKANDVGRGPGISWGAPDRTAAASSGGGGGTGASSNGPAFDPSF